ncbi:hypothetical protein [Micromonospora inositola]|uniref:Uncharacterized protein n=1 Tax=Micromonospora inositola TaxID=47865 RepID=A0A1C5HFI0_9ACTN|nr:hypothetical protein [Micromonospora inositola]SCG44809.1 hypothetical protein GA0070613_1269 [Micromonospora inositola]
MNVDRDQEAAGREEPTPVGVSVAAGAVLVVAATLLAAAVFPAPDLAGRALLVAVAVGAYAAGVADLRTVGAVAALAVATFVGFLAHRFGELTGGGDAWSYTPVIVLAVVLGAGYRRLRSVASATAGDVPPDAAAVVAPPDDVPGGFRAA